ncbi:lysophospholipid acyltransferase family protein [Actibacterium sp. 188UL27-1]|uniref:lysophospholipid acyltransferase family protein n=1 Tax=Actibacterium sp. 188UL27-1 TaxID=2786961 RepID=UPI00195D9E20|nr:lauroyl acyltransferase [Actibacterium sp. 188UL27-1]MBM7069584.1 lauroyl acyltransferase [Actibacterium sp. 188UL27-1]
MPNQTQTDTTGPMDRVTDFTIRMLIRAALMLPYATRIKVFGALTQHVIGPLIGYTARSRANLAMIYPELSRFRREKIADEVSRNTGRVLIENYAPADLAKRARNFPVTGEGAAALRDAHAQGRRIIAVSAHFGNYEAARAALNIRGIGFGGVYRPMRNPYFNDHYVDTIRAVAGPVYPSTPAGMTGFVKQLIKGVPMMLLNDLHITKGQRMPFLGKPAKTALTAAEMALRYDALLIPIYGIRSTENPLDYRVHVDAPIPRSDAAAMTLALNESLEARIAEDTAQWFWIHRRWK